MDLDVNAMRAMEWLKPEVVRVAESHGQLEKLISAGFPVGPRGRRFLTEFGGMVAPQPREPPRKRSWLKTLVWVILGWEVWSPPPTLDELLAPLTDLEAEELAKDSSSNFRLSFHSEHILHACSHDPATVLYVVSYTVGSLLSIIGTTADDRVLLLSEQDGRAFCFDFLGDTVFEYDGLNDALKSLVIGYGSCSHQSHKVRIASDEFRWPEVQLQPMLEIINSKQ